MRAPVEEYKVCPHCGKKMGIFAVNKRLQNKLTKCFRCKRIVVQDKKVY